MSDKKYTSPEHAIRNIMERKTAKEIPSETMKEEEQIDEAGAPRPPKGYVAPKPKPRAGIGPGNKAAPEDTTWEKLTDIKDDGTLAGFGKDLLPVVGTVRQAKRTGGAYNKTVDSFSKGNYWDAAGNAAVTAVQGILTGVSAVGDALTATGIAAGPVAAARGAISATKAASMANKIKSVVAGSKAEKAAAAATTKTAPAATTPKTGGGEPPAPEVPKTHNYKPNAGTNRGANFARETGPRSGISARTPAASTSASRLKRVGPMGDGPTYSPSRGPVTTDPKGGGGGGGGGGGTPIVQPSAPVVSLKPPTETAPSNMPIAQLKDAGGAKPKPVSPVPQPVKPAPSGPQRRGTPQRDVPWRPVPKQPAAPSPAKPAPKDPKPNQPSVTPPVVKPPVVTPKAPVFPAPAAPKQNPKPAPAAPKQNPKPAPGNRPDIGPTQQPSSQSLPAAQTAAQTAAQPQPAPAAAPVAPRLAPAAPRLAPAAKPAQKPQQKQDKGKEKGKRRSPFALPGMTPGQSVGVHQDSNVPVDVYVHRPQEYRVYEQTRYDVENVARPNSKDKVKARSRQAEIVRKIIEEKKASKKNTSTVIINPKLKQEEPEQTQ